MSRELLENILILVGESFWIFGAAVQLRKLSKGRDPNGLSAASQALNAAGNAAWAVYFLQQRLWFPVATNIVLFALTIGLLYFTLNNKKQFIRGVISIALLLPLTIGVLIVSPKTGGWLGATYNALAATPWLVHVLKTKKLSGISKHSLWYAQAAMTCVLTYGALIGSAPLVVGTLQGLVYMWIITYRYYKYA